ncbi:hypothetical protein B0H19DRAFT_1132871 [Mycena capillaripes]|nr:hypothetical protein B0H19DRAFT_1132871 [Mycena capillaripes]
MSIDIALDDPKTESKSGPSADVTEAIEMTSPPLGSPVVFLGRPGPFPFVARPAPDPRPLCGVLFTRSVFFGFFRAGE